MQASSSTQGAVRVGLIGADRFIHKMTDVARKSGNANLRVVPGSYPNLTETQSAQRIAEEVDVLLFAGPLPYDIVVRESDGDLGVPATYVPTGGPALHASLVRALSEGLDPRRMSIDSMAKTAISDAYTEVGLSARKTHAMPYEERYGLNAYRDFHLDLFREDKTSGAITTIPAVLDDLRAEGVPTLLMEPALLTLRQSLNNAILLGSGARFEESRIAVVIAQLPDSALPPRTSPAQYWYQELRLALHRELLREARRMDAIVLSHDQKSFLIFTTYGSLRMATDDLTRAPFVQRVSKALSIDLEVGVGLGRSTVEAENNAYRAIARSGGPETRAAYLVGGDGTNLRLAIGSEPVEAPEEGEEQGDDRFVAILRTLVDALNDSGDGRLVVDADTVARITQVTLRTARRTLQSLVAQGLAWPLPPARTRKVGRPPMLYQLLDERLQPADDHTPSDKLTEAITAADPRE
ncbi:hypothetical protein ACQBAU_01520 [Propionibacteriaceae bacterium Y2011]|uniref:hypothetical protein n=1 Tax=Microlunatus sp. Y2014 TaxID=3418488 RepID=UPI003B443297